MVPSILRYLGSSIVTDPPNTMARKGFKVAVLDPYEKAQGPAAQYRGKFNIFHELDPPARPEKRKKRE